MILSELSQQYANLFQPVMAPSPLTQLLAGSLVVSAGSVVVDVGCGSGVLSVTAVEQGARIVYAIDTNPLALAETAALARLAGCPRRVLPMLADLSDLSNIVPGPIDAIICNPPQLPSRSSTANRSERMAYDAGTDGRRYIRALIQEVKAISIRNGGTPLTVQLVTTSVAGPEMTISEFRAAGFSVSVVAEATAPFRPAYYDVVELLPAASYFRKNGELHERLLSILAIPR
ncbi:MAG: release factor glutamine methyltransferase [Thermoanaerobaculia bacterium]|jgi:release factor glutamine methyltransferase|nr:release factor glutamine methyltransferase [Thermoanaerobaculia bacterium]